MILLCSKNQEVVSGGIVVNVVLYMFLSRVLFLVLVRGWLAR
jgi:hypothetical protein